MRLYLSSFLIGQCSHCLQNMATGKKSLVIANACDGYSSKDRQEELQREFSALAELGFETEELDLRNYFSRQDSKELESILCKTDLLWVRGGNLFTLIRAVNQSKLHLVLPKLLKKDIFVYGGYSAGGCLLTSNAHGVEYVDNPNEVPQGYLSDIIWDCLGLLNFALAPHYRSDHPESASMENVVQYYIENHIPFIALRDGEVIIQNNQNYMQVYGLKQINYIK